MKVALFGGSFNPVHTGHLVTAVQLAESGLCDEVWIVPCWRNPFKSMDSGVSGKHRKKMLELSLKGFKKIRVCDYELKKGCKSYTAETLEELTKKYRKKKFLFVIGKDLLRGFRKWRDYRRITSLAGILVVDTGVDGKVKIPPYLKGKASLFRPRVRVNVSSTEVRKRVKEGKSISFLVPEKAEEYIQKNRLYR